MGTTQSVVPIFIGGVLGFLGHGGLVSVE